ncbi:hypothetical protein DVA86_04595 [Streptomyces armeniacus]|uniref:Uncharacterized protein n=1 Tax=Streptomyces armeniacus TaxID=83291 RepID=A0A345XK73_9ACTN|nr:hypothetical protein [Streptomyces armeniacus]AXK32039.1 hypothetical protein DVA86_04595 [Streptomyces armeniacus]
MVTELSIVLAVLFLLVGMYSGWRGSRSNTGSGSGTSGGGGDPGGIDGGGFDGGGGGGGDGGGGGGG